MGKNCRRILKHPNMIKFDKMIQNKKKKQNDQNIIQKRSERPKRIERLKSLKLNNLKLAPASGLNPPPAGIPSKYN